MQTKENRQAVLAWVDSWGKLDNQDLHMMLDFAVYMFDNPTLATSMCEWIKAGSPTDAVVDPTLT